MHSKDLITLSDYCELLSHAEDAVLLELERQTYLQTIAPQMVSGKMQGRFLSLISRLKQPKYILEIGTFTGYSALCLAEGLSSDGQLHTIEIVDTYDHLIQAYASKSKVYPKIKWYKGDALELIPTFNIAYDLVFLDAAKNKYLELLTMLEAKMKPGSILIADNVLWYGKVIQTQKDEETKILDLFNRTLAASKKWNTQILPLRDGLSISIRVDS
ncbi:MAG: O-methyltransferase [Saprospiraceae bacterium]|nr:O-methyltransferase [Saprospiraceae bacterium]